MDKKYVSHQNGRMENLGPGILSYFVSAMWPGHTAVRPPIPGHVPQKTGNHDK